MNDIFYIEPSLSYPGKCLIKLHPEKFCVDYASGSLNVLAARAFGLTYASYCRMCRDIFGAELHGKNEYYVVPVFEDNVLTRKLLRLLNKYAEAILWEREHPNMIAQLSENDNHNT